jgi:hypothetical protein
MQKRLTQLIALILVMTAALNAQCFASCAISSAAPQPGHACCPHHKSTHVDNAQSPSLPVALPVESAPRLAPVQLTSLADFQTLAVLPPPNRPSLTAALRI